jgi:phasin family protein
MAADAKSPFDVDFTKFFAEMKLPALPDAGALMAAHKRNMETLSAANRVALEGAQAFARRQAEIVQQNVAELSTTATPQEKAAKQAELLKHSYERGVANLRELGDLISHSNEEAIALLHRRFTEAMDEVKALAEKKK